MSRWRTRWRATGLIALTGGPAARSTALLRWQARRGAVARLERCKRLFAGRLYIEIQRHGHDIERRVEPASSISPIAAPCRWSPTNEPYFAAASDYEAHDALLCIAEGALIGEDDRRRLTPEHRFKTRAEMLDAFRRSAGGDAQLRSRSRCAAPTGRAPASPSCRASLRPREPLDEAAELRAQAEVGLAARLAAHGLAPGLTEDDLSRSGSISNSASS